MLQIRVSVKWWPVVVTTVATVVTVTVTRTRCNRSVQFDS